MTDQIRTSFRAALAGRWQIPALVVAAGLFVFGLARLSFEHEPVTFEQKLGRVQRLRELGALPHAHAYLFSLLKQGDPPQAERAELHRLLAATIYQAESRTREHNHDNLRAIVRNVRAAGKLGSPPRADDLDCLGRVHEWMGAHHQATEAYHAALRLGLARAGWASGIRRRLISIELRRGTGWSPELVARLDEIINDGEALPDTLGWAIERKVRWLLAQGGAQAALALIAEARGRLAGTAEWISVSYPEALCFRELGRHLEAEQSLRSLRNNWTERDELWGKAGWLLGVLQQQDGRPQTALSFYEEVLTAFKSGDLHDACEFSRAECLAALERYDRAFAEFTDLGRRFTPKRTASAAPADDSGDAALPEHLEAGPEGAPSDYLDGSALRTAITTIGESRLQAGDLERGLQFIGLSLSLTPDAERETKARHLARMAAGYAELARRMSPAHRDDDLASGTPPKESSEASSETESAALFNKAADAQLRLCGLQVLDDLAEAGALESAADYFDAAGQTDRMIETLHRLVATHPMATNRVSALHRLGCAYQAERDYAAAAAAFTQAIEEDPRLPHALASLVPLAECLLNMGGEHVRAGVERLIDIVDDRGPDPLFSPGATEYRQALLRLADFYCLPPANVVTSDGSQQTSGSPPGGMGLGPASDHLEKAIARLEDALVLYPDDPEAPRLRFQLAEVYRRSAQAIRENKTAMTDAAARRESERRIRAALANYSLCQGMLARHDAASLSALEQTYLRNSYLYVGDCLFDLGELTVAVEAYREAAWRYENEPAAVSSSLQVVHCYRRLGKADESRAALGRLQWLLKKIPESAFDAQLGMSPKQYWEQMAVRIESASGGPGLYDLSAGAGSRSAQ